MEIYTVQPGDSLYDIARRFGTTAERIASDNALTSPADIIVGQALVILQPTETHTVAEGDTLYSIAQQYGVSINQLWRNNPFLMGKYDVSPGQELFITLPPPIFGRTAEVTGYAYPFIDRTVLRATLPYLTYLSIFSYGIREDGTLLPPKVNDDEVIALAREYGVAPIMMLTSLGEDGLYSPDLVVRILSDEALQTILIEDIARVLADKGYSGIEFDFEFIDGTYAAAYAALVERANEELQGYLVFADLAPKERGDKVGLLYEGHDYAALGAAADRLLLMTYEYGYILSPPMAISPLPPIRQVVEYGTSVIPPFKLMLGVPNYAYDWALPFVQGQTRAVAMSNLEALQLAIERNAAIQYDESSHSPFFKYYDQTATGPVEHEVWFEDARGYNELLHLINEFGLAGLGIWIIMAYYPQLLLTINSLYGIEKALE